MGKMVNFLRRRFSSSIHSWHGGCNKELPKFNLKESEKRAEKRAMLERYNDFVSELKQEGHTTSRKRGRKSR